MIDLTDDNVLEKNVASDEQIIDLIDDKSQDGNIAEKDVPPNRIRSEIEEKRARELAEKPIRNEMRDFRISLWFRDYATFFTDFDEFDESRE